MVTALYMLSMELIQKKNMCIFTEQQKDFRQYNSDALE